MSSRLQLRNVNSVVQRLALFHPLFITYVNLYSNTLWDFLWQLLSQVFFNSLNEDRNHGRQVFFIQGTSYSQRRECASYHLKSYTARKTWLQDKRGAKTSEAPFLDTAMTWWQCSKEVEHAWKIFVVLCGRLHNCHWASYPPSLSRAAKLEWSMSLQCPENWSLSHSPRVYI